MGEYDKWEQVYRKRRGKSLAWELGEPRPVLVDLIETHRVIPKGKALDICCGLGTNTIYLAQAGFQTTGVDISKSAVAQARSKARKAGVDIRFCVGTTLDLPFEDGEFAFIFDMGCFHHILPPDREKFIQGIRRVLEKGGHYFMVCFSDENGPAWNHFSREELIVIFSPHLTIISIEHFSSLEGDGYVRSFHTTLMRG